MLYDHDDEEDEEREHQAEEEPDVDEFDVGGGRQLVRHGLEININSNNSNWPIIN